MQSWGGRSQYNRRETLGEPTKSGLVGLLAAAQGRRREDPIEDLLSLKLGVRTDQPGTLLRDFHTVSDYRGLGLPVATVDGKGRQKRRSTAAAQLTQRYYLQDAVFVAAVQAPRDLLGTIVDALCNPAFPLALGRRSCPPAQPLMLRSGNSFLWEGTPLGVLESVPWQANRAAVEALKRRGTQRPRRIDLPVTVDVAGHGDPSDDLQGRDVYEDVREDVPTTFAPRDRGFTTRRVWQTWVHLPPPYAVPEESGMTPPHDPFALLGW